MLKRMLLYVSLIIITVFSFNLLSVSASSHYKPMSPVDTELMAQTLFKTLAADEEAPKTSWENAQSGKSGIVVVVENMNAQGPQGKSIPCRRYIMVIMMEDKKTEMKAGGVSCFFQGKWKGQEFYPLDKEGNRTGPNLLERHEHKHEGSGTHQKPQNFQDGADRHVEKNYSY